MRSYIVRLGPPDANGLRIPVEDTSLPENATFIDDSNLQQFFTDLESGNTSVQRPDRVSYQDRISMYLLTVQLGEKGFTTKTVWTTRPASDVITSMLLFLLYQCRYETLRNGQVVLANLF